MALPIIEVEYFNSYWMKRIYTPQPSTQVHRSYYQSPTGPTVQQSTLGAEGNNPWMGIFPISNFEIPNNNTSQKPVIDCNINENWYLEESRIRGGYNDAPTDLGARAYLDEDEPVQQHRFNALIYSGIFNSRTGINKTNEFPTGSVITKAANPDGGSIQRLYADLNNLIVLQQDKCSRALIDKDAIYNAEGGGSVTTSRQVIGEIIPYAGEYGISNNPESFAVYAFRKYFVDRNRNAVIRLSNDGITEVQEYGMRDWFRDNLATIEDNYVNTYELGVNIISTSLTDVSTLTSTDTNCFKIVIGSKAYLEDTFGTRTFIGYVNNIEYDSLALFDIYIDRTFDITLNTGLIVQSNNKGYVKGGWDSYNKQYVISLQYNNATTNVIGIQQYETGAEFMRDGTYYTVGFDDAINGWPSFYTYRPGIMGSLKNNFYTVDNLYKTVTFDPGFPKTVWDNGAGKFGIYKHFSTEVNRGYFYQTENPATVSVIANRNPSIGKVFLTVGYEGSSGWKVTSITSDPTGFDQEWAAGIPLATWKEFVSDANVIYSYEEGAYDGVGNTGTAANPLNPPLLHAGFDRKENLYVANLINNSAPMPGEIIYGDQMGGIKGYYTIINMSTDTDTDPGGMKELYQLTATYNISSI